MTTDSTNALKMFYYADADGASLGSAITPALNYLDSGCYENVQYATSTTTSAGLINVSATGTAGE